MKLNEQEPLLNSNDEPIESSKKNILLNTEVLKKEERKRHTLDNSDLSFENNDKKLVANIFKLVLLILIISSLFFFKSKFINIKHNYLSDKTLFPLNIYYAEPKYNFVLFIILICCFTISSGFKLLLLQLISFFLTLLVIITKNKIANNPNIFGKNLVFIHCGEIIISFLYLGEKLIQIQEDNSIHFSIIMIVLFFNYNGILYFILVEIINCQYDDIIIEIIWGLIINISLYYFIFYILKNIILPKKMISFLFRYIYRTTFVFIILLIISFGILGFINELKYFFANKILNNIKFLIKYVFF